MDRHAEQAVRGGARRSFLLAALLLALASGCVSSGQLTPDLVNTNQVSQVVGMWNNQVLIGVDPAHNGAPMYGLAGRVFLFTQGMREFLLADGNMVIEMWATLPEQPQGPPVRLESWEIKKDLLNSACLGKDGWGQGYTMNLPWPSYRPDLAQVDMRIRYKPAKGLPIYGKSTVVLNNGPGPELTASRRREGPNHQPITTASPPGPAPQAGALPPPVPAPGGVQTALYQTPVQPPPVSSPYQPQPPQSATPQPFPGAAQR